MLWLLTVDVWRLKRSLSFFPSWSWKTSVVGSCWQASIWKIWQNTNTQAYTSLITVLKSLLMYALTMHLIWCNSCRELLNSVKRTIRDCSENTNGSYIVWSSVIFKFWYTGFHFFGLRSRTGTNFKVDCVLRLWTINILASLSDFFIALSCLSDQSLQKPEPANF